MSAIGRMQIIRGRFNYRTTIAYKVTPKRALESSVIRKRGIDGTVETASGFGSWAALDVSGTVF